MYYVKAYMVHKQNKWPPIWGEPQQRLGEEPGFPISVVPTVGVMDYTPWWKGSVSVRCSEIAAESLWMSIGWLGNITSGHWEGL